MKPMIIFSVAFFICFALNRPAAAAEFATPNQELRAVAPPYIAPTVLSPAPGQRLYANAFFPLKLAPPQGMDVAEYLVTFEKKDASGNWIAYSRDPIAVSGAPGAISRGLQRIITPGRNMEDHRPRLSADTIEVESMGRVQLDRGASLAEQVGN